MYTVIAGYLPWDLEFRKRILDKNNREKKNSLSLFSDIRREMFDKFTDIMC